MTTAIPLSKAIKAHGADIDVITLRNPTTEDVIELGLPTLIIPGADGNSTGVEIRQSVIARYVMRLGGIPLTSVKALSLKDFSLCTAAVMGFFGESDGEAVTAASTNSATESSTSPTSGD